MTNIALKITPYQDTFLHLLTFHRKFRNQPQCFERGVSDPWQFWEKCNKQLEHITYCIMKKVIYTTCVAEVYFSLRLAQASDNSHYNEHYYFNVVFNVAPYLYQYTQLRMLG